MCDGTAAFAADCSLPTRTNETSFEASQISRTETTHEAEAVKV